MIDIDKPIPSNSDEREAKKLGYLDHPLDTTHSKFDEPLVPISEYGIKGTGYYSRPNRVTGEPLDWVNPDVYVRESVAEKLKAVNEHLATDPRIADHLGGAVELNVRDGYRSLELQNDLHSIHYPALLRKLNPDWSEEDILAKRDQVIAKGNPDSPHVSGGAVDVDLVYKGSQEGVFNAQGGNIAKDAVNPEYLEWVEQNQSNPGIEIPTEIRELSPAAFRRAQMARRVLYNLMTSPEVGSARLIVNPVETWHFSMGDKLSAMLESHQKGVIVPAYYGAATEPKGYRI